MAIGENTNASGAKMIKIAKVFSLISQITHGQRINILPWVLIASLLVGSSHASAEFFDQLLDKAQGLAQPLSGSVGAVSRLEPVAPTKGSVSSFSTEHLLGISEPYNPVAPRQLATDNLGNAAEFDPVICNFFVKKLAGMNNEGSLIYGSKELTDAKLTADVMELRLSACRFAQTKGALGQMASLLYSALGNATASGKLANGNDRVKALQVIASAFVDAGNFPKAIEAAQLSINPADFAPQEIQERAYAIRTMVHAFVAQGDRGTAEAKLTQFVVQNRGQLEQRDITPTLFALGEAYHRLGYPEKAAYIYFHASSTLNKALNATAANPFAAIALAMAGMQCMLNDQIVRLGGMHLTKGYICDSPYRGISLSEVRYAQTTTLLGKADDLADYYRNVFQPSLNMKTPEGWLAPPVLPAKIRAHAVFAESLEKAHKTELALVAWERIADDIATFEDYIAGQSLMDDAGSITHDDFAKYLGRFLLIATQTKSANKQTKALEYWLAFKGLTATQYKFGLDLLNRSGNSAMARALVDADQERMQVRQQLLNGSTSDVESIMVRIVDVTNKVFSARQEFVQKLSGMVDKDVGIGQTARTILASVRNSLTEDGVFVDFTHTESNEGESIYLMSVIDKAGGVQINVVSGTKIDNGLAELQRNIRAAIGSGQIPAKETVDRSARVLFDSMGGLLLAATNGKSILHISPDGVLGSYPFEISLDKAGNYPFSEKIISYVSAPRDFVTKQGAREESGVTVVANPDYLGDIPPAVGANRYVGRGFQFPALPDTELEAKFIRDMGSKLDFPTASLSGAAATKSALLNAPIMGNILHFATHGFYFSDNFDNAFGEATVARRSSDRNPLWRAGLAMAGANKDREGGILYAAEVLRMDLKNTDIVVLSACDTGSGYYSSAEGVVGLTRAFTISGARSVISSKWPVSSAETVKFMEYLYKQNPRGRQAAKAMRDARLVMYKEFSNPYLWGAFTINQSGN